MTELADDFRAMQDRSKDKRATNRAKAVATLQEKGIIFTEHNYGAHLIVEGRDCYIDYWPGTGKWNMRSGKRGFGLNNLLKEILP